MIDTYLENIQEGRIWDKVKKVWRDHKGKIIAGASIGATALTAIHLKNKNKQPANTSSITKNKKRFDPWKKKKDKLRKKAIIAKQKCPGGTAVFSLGKFVGCGEAGRKIAKNNFKNLFKNKQNGDDNDF